MTERANNREISRFGIGEWYGDLFTEMPPGKRRECAANQKSGGKRHCPFKFLSNPVCTKKGRVCSLRCYLQKGEDVFVPEDTRGTLRTTCPSRFEEGGMIFQWVSEIILNDSRPNVIKEIGFLEKTGVDRNDDVGRIDMVLVNSNPEKVLSWCALEIQAVYFSGDSMGKDFKSILDHERDTLPFPAGRRRPDYRSSGPKRLMPQLQIKVPTLRRWGRKMAVIIDRDFFDSLGPMDSVDDISNCDIAWFVVKYAEKDGKAVLEKDFVQFTTLERAVEGLTGGVPVTLREFETRVRHKLAKEYVRVSR